MNYNLWIKIISIAIPLVVAILFGVKIDYELEGLGAGLKLRNVIIDY